MQCASTFYKKKFSALQSFSKYFKIDNRCELLGVMLNTRKSGQDLVKLGREDQFLCDLQQPSSGFRRVTKRSAGSYRLPAMNTSTKYFIFFAEESRLKAGRSQGGLHRRSSGA
jgi:hypothetical protein